MRKFMQWWKLAVFATLVMMLAVSNVSAFIYSAGVVVPRAVQNDSNIDTVVGLTSLCQGTVYWALFTRDSVNVMDGHFNVTCNDLYKFSLNAELGSNLIDEECYLVFGFGGNDTSVCTSSAKCKYASLGDKCCGSEIALAANAFLIDTSADDVVFVPVLPLMCWDFEEDTDLSLMDRWSIQSVEWGMEEGYLVDVRYWIDPAYHGQTTMVVWTVGNRRGYEHIKVYDDEENRRSITMCWRYKELNLFDPADKDISAIDKCKRGSYGEAAAFSSWPDGYIDGFIRFCMPADGIAYSYVKSSDFGAAQTLLGALSWCEDQCNDND